MGKVRTLILKLKAMNASELVERYRHIVGAQAIRTYMGSKPDPCLDIEVRITEEEVQHRISQKIKTLCE